MQKTLLMIESEKKIGKSLEIYLTYMYKKEKQTTSILAQRLNVHRATVGRWLAKLGIKTRSGFAYYLKKSVEIPSKKELDCNYNILRRPVKECAKEKGVHTRTYYRWLENAGIERRYGSEAHLPPGITRPSREELEELTANKTDVEASAIYGVDTHTFRTWKKREGIYKFRKSKYDDLSLRLNMLRTLIKDGGKTIEELTSVDFGNVKQSNGRSYRGLINWYLARWACLYPIAKMEFIKDYNNLNGKVFRPTAKLSLESALLSEED